jgi:ElaB/YqjD/DUF883 family membrane-anchored ribosome-binding protein
MAISADLRRAPLRLTTGALVINSGISQFNADAEASAKLHQTASKYVPQLERLDPQVFSKMVAAGQLTVGAALLVPIVPSVAAGLGLSLLGGSLAATKWRTDGMQTPTEDVLLAGSGVSLLLDSLTSPAHDKHVEISATVQEKANAKKRQLRRSRRRAAALAASAQLGDKAHDAGERLQQVGEKAGERIVELRDEYQPVAAKKLKKARKKARKQSQHLSKQSRKLAQSARESVQQAVA